MRAHAWYYMNMKSDGNNFSILFDLIGTLSRRRFRVGEQGFAKIGLNHTEARVLTLLDREGGESTQEALSGMLTVDRSNAGRAMKNLEGEGYVLRTKDSSDARTNIVKLTAKGTKIVGKIAKLRKEMAQSFFGDLTEDEAGIVIDLLNRAEPKGEK